MRPKVIAILSIIVLTLILTVSCKNSSTTTTSTTPLPTTYTLSELKYKLLAAYPDYFWCDPDFYPVARPGIEQQNALNKLPLSVQTKRSFPLS